MRPALSLPFAVAAAVFLPMPAQAQQPWEPAANVEQALARIIDDALPRADQDWALTWCGFGVRGGRDVFWHMFTPEQAQATAARAQQFRSGWLSAGGAGGDVMVCGDRTRIRSLSLSTSDIWLGREDVVDLLGRRGIAAILIETRERPPTPGETGSNGRGAHYRSMLDRYPGYRKWRIEAPRRTPAELVAVHGCTPPGTRSATQCRMTWTLHFAADGTDAPHDAAAPCLDLGRYTH